MAAGRAAAVAGVRRTADRVAEHSLYERWVSPSRLRVLALRELWVYRLCWRRPEGRERLRNERDRELSELVPVMVFFALMVAAGIFVAMPLKMGDRATPLLEQFWPVWVVQVAPMLVALTMSLLNTPSLALQLTELDAQGAFAPTPATQGDPHARSALICLHVMPIIVAHIVAGVVATVLVVTFSLVLGVLAAFVLATADVRTMLDVIFGAVTPLDWWHTLVSAALLATVCNVSAVAYAWPGAFRIQRGLDMHRLGMRTMLVSCATCMVVWLAQSTILSLIAADKPAAQSQSVEQLAKEQPALVGGSAKGK